jgi:hypothetical protein
MNKNIQKIKTDQPIAENIIFQTSNEKIWEG